MGLPRLDLLWERSLGKGHSAVVCDGESVYSQHLESEHEVVSCWRLDDGNLHWSYRYAVGFHSYHAPYDGPHSTPALGNNYIITASIDAQIHAIDAADGLLIWQVDLKEVCGTRLPQSGYASSPLIWNDCVILPALGEATKEETEDFVLNPDVPAGRDVVPGAVALDIRTGKEVWRTETFRSSHSSPIALKIDCQPMIVFHTMFELIGVDPADGSILWRQLLRSAAADNVSFTPLWDSERRQFLVCHGYCDFGAQAIMLEKINGKWRSEIAWTNSRMQIVHTNGVLTGTTLIGTNRETATLLVGIDVRDGSTLFRQRGFGKSNLLVTEDRLLILDEGGELVAGQLDEQGFTEQWRDPVLDAKAWTVPSVVAGQFLLMRDNRQLKVYRFAM